MNTMQRYFLFTTFLLFCVLVAPVGADAAARSLTLGMSGTDVKEMQQALIGKG